MEEVESCRVFVERDQWKTFLDEFSKRNQLRDSSEAIGEEIGAQEEEQLLPFSGVNFETKGIAAGSVEIILGVETAAEKKTLLLISSEMWKKLHL